MNKVKMFFIAAALVLTTAGVFAGKAKFASFTLYGYNSAVGYKILSPSAVSVDVDALITTQSGTQAAITNSAGGANYSLYGYSTGYTKLYTSF